MRRRDTNLPAQWRAVLNHAKSRRMPIPPQINHPCRISLPDGAPDMWCSLDQLMPHLDGDGWRRTWITGCQPPPDGVPSCHEGEWRWNGLGLRHETTTGAMVMPSVTVRAMAATIRMTVNRPYSAHHHAPFAWLRWCEPQQEWRLVRPATG